LSYGRIVLILKSEARIFNGWKL